MPPLHPILTAEWCELWTSAAAGVEPGKGPSGTLETVVRSDDGATRSFTMRFENGALTSATLGDDADAGAADVRIELPYDAYRDFLSGDRSVLQRCILNGQLRMTGDPDLADPLMGVIESDAYREVRLRVHGQTQY